jgi:hypothetical protein
MANETTISKNQSYVVLMQAYGIAVPIRMENAEDRGNGTRTLLNESNKRHIILDSLFV